MNLDLLEVDKVHFNELREHVDEQKFKDVMQKFIYQFTYDSITIEGKNALSKSDIENLLNKKDYCYTIT